jgi:Pentapeptide repeats (8 copies)
MAPHASVATMSLGSGPEQRPVSPRLALPAGGWLAHHDVGPAWQPCPPAARDAARGRLLALGAGLLAAGALVVTARSRARSRAGQLADRYALALGQLGREELDVRIGGIHALERVARDSPGHHPAVMEMLAAFIRERSRQHWPPPGPGGQPRERSPRPDVQAAITALGRRRTERDLRPVDLAGADLTGADLADADLAGADLARARFAGAELTGALWPAGGPVPAGWERHTGSGQLIAAGTGADRAAAGQPHR